MLPLMVTGGCGFIGSNFIRYLLETDLDVCVINYDAVTYAGNLANWRRCGRTLVTVRAPATSRTATPSAGRFGRGGGIVNFAAESHVDRSIHDSRPFLHTNVIGTQVLLDAAREFQAPRFLQVSTDEVYGSLGETGALLRRHRWRQTARTRRAKRRPTCWCAATCIL